MQSQKNKGSALISIIMIIVVLILLGAALLNVSFADAKHADIQTKKIQAHYLGRSGIYVGAKILQDTLISDEFIDLQALVDNLNNQVSALPSESYTMTNIGTYALNFENLGNGKMKIVSIGTTDNVSPTTDTVTLTINIIPPMTMLLNPDDWINGINLIKGINKDKNYLGSGVTLESKPIQSPQGTDQASVFQASIIYFRDHNGYSLRQVTNSVPITFDGEIIFFESGVLLNKTSDPVYLSISSDVLDYRANNQGIISQYAPAVGFEDYNRYLNFITSHTIDRHSSYINDFLSNNHYGVVYFGGDVVADVGGNSTIKKYDRGWYYYKSGVNLHQIQAGDLISIPEDDAIINAIKNMFSFAADINNALWNNK